MSPLVEFNALTRPASIIHIETSDVCAVSEYRSHPAMCFVMLKTGPVLRLSEPFQRILSKIPEKTFDVHVNRDLTLHFVPSKVFLIEPTTDISRVGQMRITLEGGKKIHLSGRHSNSFLKLATRRKNGGRDQPAPPAPPASAPGKS